MVATLSRIFGKQTQKEEEMRIREIPIEKIAVTRGRPKLPEGQRRDISMSLVLNQPENEKLQAIADELGGGKSLAVRYAISVLFHALTSDDEIDSDALLKECK